MAVDTLKRNPGISLFDLYELLVLSGPPRQLCLASHRGQGHAAREVQSLVAMPDSPGHWQLESNVFGLTGVNSPLPAHLQEALAEQGADSIARLLVRLLDHHLMSGLCQRWQRRRRFHPDWQATLTVLNRGYAGPPAPWSVPAMPGSNAPADVVAMVLCHSLRLPRVSVRQWRRVRLPVPEHDRARPGGPGRLGHGRGGDGVRLGRFVEVSNAGVEIHFHDLDQNCWRRLSSADGDQARLRELCRRLLPDVCQLRLVLHPRPMDRDCQCLGGSARLGRSLWLAGAQRESRMTMRTDLGKL